MSHTPIANYQPLPNYVLKPLWLGLKQWFKPEFKGLEHLDQKRPALYIGNHTVYGYDSAAFVFGVYQHSNIWLRGLADHVHFYLPLWGNRLEQFGAFDGTRDSVVQLMQAKQHILLYPGGSREVLKNKGEKYQLFWKDRLGFAELAIQYGYDIVPFAALGGEEAVDIIYDANDFNHSILGKLAKKSGFSHKFLRNGKFFFPISLGYKHIPFFPKPVPLTFKFMPRIATTHFQHVTTSENKWQLRRQVEAAIEQALKDLKSVR